MSRRPTPRPTPPGAPRARPSGTPGGRRPQAGRRRSEKPQVERTHPAPPRQITVRTLVLAVVLLMAFVLITPTLRAYVRQQEDLRDLNADLAAAQQEAKELEAAIARWDNDEYVRAQARERFGFVMPGERPFRVLDPETITGEEPELESDLVAAIPTGEGPWYLDLWESVEIAGELEP